MLRSRVPSAFFGRTVMAATPVSVLRQLGSRRFAGSHKSTAVGTSKFRPKLEDVVDWDEDKFPVTPIDVAPLAGELLKYVQRNAAAFVLGSPGCGKSSLMQHIIQTEAYKNYGFKHVVKVKKNTDVDDVMDQLQTPRAKATCLFLVDEAQRAVAEGWADPSALYKQGYFAMYFGTTALITRKFATPAELAPHKFWMYAPTLDREVVTEYVESVLTLHGVAKGEAENLAPWVFDYSGASMNTLVATLKAMLVKSPRNSTISMPDVAELSLPTPAYVAEFDCPWVTVNGQRNWAKVDGKVELAAELLAGGVATIDAKSSEALKRLLRHGFVHPVPDYGAEPATALRHLRDTSTEVTWAHPWQPLYARKLNILAAKAAPVRRAGVPQTTIDAVVRLLPLMELCTAVPAHTAARDSKLRQLSEADAHSAIERAARDLGSECLEVKTQKQAARKKKKRGTLPRVDLMFMPPRGHAPGRPRRRMALELTADATVAQLREHTARFRPKTGKYATLNLADWLVLDFRTTPQTRKEVTNRVKKLKVATVSPHTSYGWGVAVLDYRGKRVYVPLDGVPRYVPDWDAVAPEARPTRTTRTTRPTRPTRTAVTPPGVDVHVALPDGPLQTDVASLMRRYGLKMNVDGLRHAIIAILPGLSFPTLQVYPPGAAHGAAPIADPYTELVPTTKEAPYHVTVAGVSPPSFR